MVKSYYKPLRHIDSNDF